MTGLAPSELFGNGNQQLTVLDVAEVGLSTLSECVEMRLVVHLQHVSVTHHLHNPEILQICSRDGESSKGLGESFCLS